MFEKSGKVGQQGACVTGKTPLVVIGSPNRKGSVVYCLGKIASTPAGPVPHTASQQEAMECLFLSVPGCH